MSFYFGAVRFALGSLAQLQLASEIVWMGCGLRMLWTPAAGRGRGTMWAARVEGSCFFSTLRLRIFEGPTTTVSDRVSVFFFCPC